MKRILVFILAAVLLVGVAPVKEAKAEETYYDLDDVLTFFGYTWDESLDDFIRGGYKESYPYYAIFYSQFNSQGYYTHAIVLMPTDAGLCVDSTCDVYGTGNTSIGDCMYFQANALSGEYPEIVSLNQGIVHCLELPSYGGAYFYLCYCNFANFTTYYPSRFVDLRSSVVIENNETHECSWVSKETAATCTTSGRTWEECSCGAIQNEVEIPALGHTWVQKEVPGSCIDDSKAWEECSVCAEVQNEVITPASGHVWITKTDPATCTEAGSSWEECSCGAVQNETEIAALGHGILIYEVAQQPTLESEGSFIRTCSVCGEVIESGTIPMVTPSPTPTPTLAPDPELVSRVSDFSLIVIVSMLLMKDFPLNLLLVSCLMCVAVVVFDKYKRSLNKK